MLPAAVVLLIANCGSNYFCYKSGDCLTAKQCLDYPLYPYVQGMVCLPDIPNTSSGLFQNEKGAYLCPTGKVTVFNASAVRCVDSTAECTGLFVSKNGCVEAA